MHCTSVFYGNDQIGVGAFYQSPAIQRDTIENSSKNGRPKGAPTNNKFNNISDEQCSPLQTAGITLIALIITIILLLILAGITLHFTLGENGILRNAEIAGKKYSEEVIKETIDDILVDMQMEEIKNGHKLDLAKVAQNLASKDKNITLEVFNEGDTELKGTYTINGQEYEFTINNKFETTVTAPTEEKIVKIENIIWENGKPKVSLTSSQTGIIEYKDTDGTWKPYNESVNVNNGDTLTLRVNTGSGTTKEETIVVQDKTAPTEFEIEIFSENIKSNEVTVNLKTIPQDNETGLKDYTYVAEGRENKKEIPNITTTSYTITEIALETSYSIYVLAYDFAGNYRKSNVLTITTPAYVPPTAGVGAATHTAKQINYDWGKLHQIAKVISDNYGLEEGKINNNTAEVNISIDGENITLGIGDWKTLNGKQVRILGFNHDELTNSEAYGEGETNTYAGISFEFVECLMVGVMINSNNSQNVGGWGACTLRGTLNSTTLESFENKQYIKQINKQYIEVYNDAGSVKTSQDKLWLLSCSEIWNNGDKSGYYGKAMTKEGEQYKYYKTINAKSTTGNVSLIKKYNGVACYSWLRSRRYDYVNIAAINPYGGCYDISGNKSQTGTSPGFSM